MRRVLALAMFAIVSISPAVVERDARADRSLVPSVAAGLAIGGPTLRDAPMYSDAHYASASLTWAARDRDDLSVAPELSALGVWHGASTPVGLVGLRVDQAVASSTTLTLSAHLGSAHDLAGMHPAGDATLALHAGTRLQLGFEVALTGWGATMMMGGDAMQTKLVFARFGITLGTPL